MKITRKKVFSGRLISLFKGTKKLPNGREAYFEEVVHPGASICVPLVRGRVVLIRQYRAVIGKYIWELPAGTLDGKESPRICAKREVQEETGYKVRNLKKLGKIYTTPGFCNEVIHVYKAECSSRGNTDMDFDEMIKVESLTKKEVRGLFESGKITDSKTISALSMAGIL
ncbi:NUDIX hydrolase [Candidatus Omnitrophota bacterium]